MTTISDLPNDHQWFGLENLALVQSKSRPILLAAMKQTIRLSNIFQDIMAEIFSPKRSSPSKTSLVQRLDSMNMRLAHWLSELPVSLQWLPTASPNRKFENHVVMLQYVFPVQGNNG